MYNMKQIVEEELKKGFEATSQLRSLLAQPQVSDEKCLTEKYATTIINSFDTSIAILKKMVRSMEMESSSSSLAKTTDTCLTKPRLRTIETSSLAPDRYIWRKYGKKSINNTKYPRDYYRCAYKDDKKCEAIKHVQKISDNPMKYKITYYAEHICQAFLNNNNNNVPSIDVLNGNERKCTNFTISFESKTLSSPCTQNLNRVALDSSSSPCRDDGSRDPPLLTITSKNHSPPDALASTTIIEPKLVDDAAYTSYPEQLYSPTIFMSPNYYMTSSNVETVEDYSLLMLGNPFDTSDALLQDLPLWE